LEHPARTEAIVYLSGTGLGHAWNAAYHEEASRRRTAEERVRLAELAIRARSPDEEREYRILKWAPDVADRHRARELVEGLNAPYEINLDVNRDIVAETRPSNEHELLERCRAITAPMLIVHGEHDPRPSWSIHSLADTVPHAVVKILPDVGHLPWLERPATLAEPLRRFLAEL
jgi:proline iminopeptidase